MRHGILFLVVLCLSSVAANAVDTVVLYGDDDYPPYSYVEQGQFKGIYVDLLQAVAARLKDSYHIELQAVPWKRGLALMESGSAFALFPPYLRKERTFIQPYSVPLYHEQVVVVCNQAAMHKGRAHFPDDFGDVTIGVNTGFALSDAFVRARAAGLIKVDESKGNERNLLKLADGRIDCYANDRMAIRYALGQLRHRPSMRPVVDSLQMVETIVLSEEDAYIGYGAKSNPPYKQDFIARMNAELQALKREGVVDRLASEYGR